jgi:hypothetical protein
MLRSKRTGADMIVQARINEKLNGAAMHISGRHVRNTLRRPRLVSLQTSNTET